MTIDEITKAIAQGCCSRTQAATKGCALCVPMYAAVDEVTVRLAERDTLAAQLEALVMAANRMLDATDADSIDLEGDDQEVQAVFDATAALGRVLADLPKMSAPSLSHAQAMRIAKEAHARGGAYYRGGLADPDEPVGEHEARIEQQAKWFREQCSGSDAVAIAAIVARHVEPSEVERAADGRAESAIAMLEEHGAGSHDAPGEECACFVCEARGSLIALRAARAGAK